MRLLPLSRCLDTPSLGEQPQYSQAQVKRVTGTSLCCHSGSKNDWTWEAGENKSKVMVPQIRQDSRFWFYLEIHCFGERSAVLNTGRNAYGRSNFYGSSLKLVFKDEMCDRKGSTGDTRGHVR